MRSIDRFFGLLPADVDVAISTTSWSEQITNQERFDATAIDRPIETLIEAVSDLQRYDRIDVAMVTGDFIQAALGPAWNDEARRAVAEASGLPALTAMTAATDALRAVGATRIAVATPFSAAKNEHVRAYLAAEGFAVERMTGL